MKRTRVMRLGSSGIVLSLCVACAGQVHNLGDEGNAGAGGADANGSSTGGKSTGGKSTGGTGGKSSGGTNTGGMSPDTTVAAGIAYPLAPTVPIDPACTCASNTQICNAANQCVDRCDSAGHCAKWLTNSAVKSLYVEGKTLYYATAPKTDPLGNPGTNGSLYRVEYPDGTPTLIATGLQNPQGILGRYNGATYLNANTGNAPSLYRVSDTGEVKKILDGYASSMRGKWLAYTTNEPTELKIIDLSGELTPKVLASSTDNPAMPNATLNSSTPSVYVTDNELVFTEYLDNERARWCHVGLARLDQEPSCAITVPGILGETIVEGDTLFIHSGGISTATGVASHLTDGTAALGLYAPNRGSTTIESIHVERILVDQGFVYTLIYDDVSDSHRIIRFPTNVGRLPQDVLSAAVTEPSFDSSDTRTVYDGGYTVSNAGVFWYQRMTDTNDSQYIFHSPLPAQPCDAELPCADNATTCSNGFCAAP